MSEQNYMAGSDNCLVLTFGIPMHVHAIMMEMNTQPERPSGVSAAVGLRERKKERLRGQLEDTAIAVFSEEGYTETPVDVIAERLQISPRTVYRYFPLKEDLVFSAERRFHAEGLRRMSQSSFDEPALTSLNRLITYFEQRLVDRRSREFAFHSLVARTPELSSSYLGLMNRLEVQISRMLEARPGFSDVQAAGWTGALLAAALLTSHRVAVTTWIDVAPEEWLPTIVRRHFALLTTSLSTVPGWSEIARATRPD